MKVVIDIAEEDYKRIKLKIRDSEQEGRMTDAVYTGFALPRGHGDLIDANALKQEFDIIASKSATGEWQFIPIRHIKQIIDSVPTVIEADRGE